MQATIGKFAIVEHSSVFGKQHTAAVLPAMAPFSLIYSVLMCEIHDHAKTMSQARLRRHLPTIDLIRRVIMIRRAPFDRLLRRLRAAVRDVITRIGLVAALGSPFGSSNRVALPPPFALELALRIAFLIYPIVTNVAFEAFSCFSAASGLKMVAAGSQLM